MSPGPHAHAHGSHGHGPHGHGPGAHSHHHLPDTFGRAFAIGAGLNLLMIVAEVAAGLWGGSVALLADAGHNISDVLGLLAAWLAHALARRAATARFTYGFGASSMLAALFNAVLLLLAVGALSLEAVRRLSEPAPVAGGLVMGVALLGAVVNGASAMLFAAGRKNDLNIRGAYLHMLSDALVSLGVVAAGGVIALTGWLWLDPVASLAINLVIVVGTWGLLRDSLRLCLQGVPPGIDIDAVRRCLLEQAGVAGAHDLHVWSISTASTALSVHLVMPAGHPGDDFLARLGTLLRERFAIDHATLQVETDLDGACPLGHAHGGPAVPRAA